MLTDKGKELQLQDLLTGTTSHEYLVVWKIQDNATTPFEAARRVWQDYFTNQEADFVEVFLDGEKVAEYNMFDEL